jgi:hypothetical protein
LSLPSSSSPSSSPPPSSSPSSSSPSSSSPDAFQLKSSSAILLDTTDSPEASISEPKYGPITAEEVGLN